MILSVCIHTVSKVSQTVILAQARHKTPPCRSDSPVIFPIYMGNWTENEHVQLVTTTLVREEKRQYLHGLCSELVNGVTILRTWHGHRGKSLDSLYGLSAILSYGANTNKERWLSVLLAQAMAWHHHAKHLAGYMTVPYRIIKRQQCLHKILASHGWWCRIGTLLKRNLPLFLDR